MKNFHLATVMLFLFPVLFTVNTNAQSKPSVAELNKFISNNQLLVTYREGEALYGTYYFIEIHYCPNGYGLYGRTVKKTVLGNEQKSNWQEFGTWKVMEYNGNTGVYYKTTAGQENFVPVYRFANGNLSTGEGVTIIKQGPAICN